MIEVILRARDSVSQVAQKVVRSLDDIQKAQKGVDDATRASRPTTLQRITELQKMVEAHTREKKALEESSKARREEANALREAAKASQANLERLQHEAALERTTAALREKTTAQEVTRIRLQVAERQQAGRAQDELFARETQRLHDEAALLAQVAEAQSQDDRARQISFTQRMAQARVATTEADQRVQDLRRQSQAESAIASERENRDRDEYTRLKRIVAERELEEGQQDKKFKSETARIRKEAALIKARADEESAANRRRASEIGTLIAAAQLESDAARTHVDNLREESTMVSQLASQREAAAKQEIASLRDRISEREKVVAAEDSAFAKETANLRDRASLLEADARSSSSANRLRVAELGEQIAMTQHETRERSRAAGEAETIARNEERSHTRVGKALDQAGRELERLISRTTKASGATGPFTRALDRMGFSTGNAKAGLKGLNAEFQGFQIALIIKYAQALVSALVTLGAQFVAVAAAAGQAAIGIGGALAAGAAQAVPVVGVLIAAFSRLTAVLKIVKLFNQQQLTATHNAGREAKAQATATDQIRSAEQRVADAHRATARAVTDLARTRSDAARQEVQAQQDVNKARKDAIRTVQDLMAAEEDAAQQLLQSQQSRQRAIETGDVMGAVQGEIDVTRARRDVGRARQDAAPVRARGVEGVDAVQQAEQRLADTRRQGARQIQQSEQSLGDARRNEVQATQDLSRTRRQAADNLAQETAAADKLTDSIKQLSPAERTLYRRILALQETYRRVARPITDIITRAFTGVVERVTSLLRDPRNIPIVTRILINFFRAARNIVIAGVPAFRLLLRYVEGYSKQAEHASRHSKGIRDFFSTGVRYAKSFFDLGLAVVRLLLSISGRGGAAGEGIRTIKDLTKVVDNLTDKANHNAGAIRRFFHRTHDAFFEILGVLGNLASTLISAFSPESVKSFADFLNRIIIPALGDAIKLLGVLATAFHQLISLPGVADVARLAATFLLLAKGLTVVRLAVADLMGIIPAFLRAFGLMLTATEAAEAGVTGLAMLTGVGEIVLIIGAIIAAIVLLDRKFHFLAPTWRWIKHAAVDAFDAIKKAAASVASWFSDVWTQGLLYWIRWPFVWLAKHVSVPIFDWLIHAAENVIGWLKRHFGHGGDFAIVGELITFPFRSAKAVIKANFEIIKTIIGGALDIIAGRFGHFSDRMSDFWSGFIDMGRGAVSSLLGIVGDLLGALGHIPKLGGPFRDAAKAVHEAQHNIDDLRDSTKKHRQEQKRSNDAVKDSLPNLVKLHDRYRTATDRLDKLRPGTKGYRDAVKAAHEASRPYNAALKDTAEKAGNARQPISKLRGNIQNLGDVSADTAQQVAYDLNGVLSQVGARMIRLNTRAYKHSGIDEMTRVTGHGATGGALSRAHGLRQRMWGGGIANPYGGAADDHVLLSPTGSPVAALSGTEGIINRPQMGVIDQALSFTRQMTGMPWGSLNELWGSGMRHYATGGGLQPGIRNLSNRLDRMFGLTTTSTTGGNHAANSYHYRGLAADISGSPAAMARAARYIRSSGISRQLLEGIHNPGLSVSHGQNVSPAFWGASTWADHMDHIHLAAGRAVNAAMARVRMPRIQGLGNDALSRIARGGARMMTRAANRYLQRQMNRLGGGDTKAMGADANVVSAFRRAMRDMRANPKERLAGWEAGIVESGLKNLHYGDRDSLGSLQERAGIFGRAHALNPYASMLRFLRDAISKRPWRGSAGSLAQAVQRSAIPGAYDQVRGRAMRYLQGGGLLRGAVRGPTMGGLPSTRAVRIPSARNPAASILTRITHLFDDVSHQLDTIARGPLSRSKHLLRRVESALSRITGDGGLLDQMRDATESITARVARNLQRRQFRVTRRGPRRDFLDDAQIARANLQGFQAQRTGLRDERGAIQDSIGDAESALAVAHRKHNKKAAAAARAALVNLRTRLDANTTAMAQNAQDQVEAQEQFQDGLLARVNDAADRQNSAIDRWSRVAKALGQNLDPNVVLGAQIQTMQTQIGGLQGVLAQARRTGNTTLANTISSSIDDLNTQIAEAVAQQFQNSIDAVNNEAQKQTTRLDRETRIAQLGGQTDFGAMGRILGRRGDVITNQQAGLQALLMQAQASGNIEQFDSLKDQLAELDTQLAENTQAIKDNTDAAFNFTTQKINDAAGFGQGVFGGAQGFFQALSEATGINTGPQQLAALQGIATTLATQTQGLQSQLASLTGDNSVLGLSGADLVNYLVSISSGPAFQAIMARLDPTQQSAFQDLITGLLANATATVQNTQAIQNLTNPNAQSFSSTLWSTFRRAIFTGAGGLLPQYATTIPTAAIGAHVMQSGMMLVHAGEDVRPARITRDWRGGDGDTYHLNVTTPTEVLNPTDVGRQLAFYRKNQGGR